ncbi:Ribokinase-like protein [Gilbertella persicaria]|uniref:Ribokinase-like protein n=1 Tax=Gilbertella persicaria TaxID=101096 RepID=UPI002220DE27|nr:Ribokinase-like protein [Gilbertella persicaria]KAI8090219.1 Ribokinase-like protein [Gilbertella persicaria]
MAPAFSSIGGLILDDIVYQDGRRVNNILGGGGVFAIYGMRIWQSNSDSKNVGYVIHKGFDYPAQVDDQLNQLDIAIQSIVHSDKHTTRGLNTFGENDHRDFEYIHPIIRVTASDFPDSWIKSIKILHLICSAERAIEIIDEWREREQVLAAVDKTQFIWEPLPWACLPENLERIYEASQKVDIISPNHEELADMLGTSFHDLLIQHNHDFKATVAYCGQQFVQHVDKVLVVRASKYGAMVISDGIHWIPAYSKQEDVVDVTGAGNTFCGGYAYGWIHTKGDPVESAYYGAVSASYTVEQVGVPVFNHGEWNHGPSPEERLARLKGLFV